MTREQESRLHKAVTDLIIANKNCLERIEKLRDALEEVLNSSQDGYFIALAERALTEDDEAAK